MLNKVKTPADVKNLSETELKLLADEMRREIVKVVAKNGGHLASNLGAVELTLAMHRVFDLPKDKIIFDVGHQCYAHKLLTGRADRFHTLRHLGGISGFTNVDESEYDTVTAGHSGPSVSAALGIASAEALKGSDAITVAVVGDGSFTNGMIFEALNNCSGKKLKLIIVLNDNGMSISENVGGLPKYFSRIRTSEWYFNFKYFMKKYFIKLPLIGKVGVRFAGRVKNAVKRLLFSDNVFECLGLEYLGPVDGNDIEKLTKVLTEASTRDECTVVHVRTKKGLGYEPAEKYPHRYHSASPFDIDTGESAPSAMTFTNAVSETICSAAQRDEKICAVSAAMTDGVGLGGFADLFPDRFFDVGIAEEHALTFCGGLSLAGYHPICMLYSTFAQRVYDQMFHDIVLQKTPITFLLSHAGLVPGDGITHQGLFDIPLFSSIPGVNIYSPDGYDEISELINNSLHGKSVDIIRYPKGPEACYDRSSFKRLGDVYYSVPEGAECVIITYGRMSEVAFKAAERFGGRVGIIRVSRILPLPINEILTAMGDVKYVYILEEGMRRGGFAERLSAHFIEREVYPKTVIHAVNGEFVSHGSLSELYERFGFTPDEVASRVGKLLSK